VQSDYDCAHLTLGPLGDIRRISLWWGVRNW